MKRRDFIKTGTISLVASGSILTQCDSPIKKVKNNPIVLSTWDHGISANNSAMDILNNNGTALDAVESGVRVTEADPSSQSVGLGGRPDQDGHVTLDACIMDSDGNAGSVAFLRDIKHPISVARKVMKLTDHVMLVGAGAKRFALENGFQEENLLTDKSKEEWLQWKRDNSVKDSWGPNDEHDTISTLARDNEGNLSGACTTSGLAYKLHGRVGDSPIIGARAVREQPPRPTPRARRKKSEGKGERGPKEKREAPLPEATKSAAVAAPPPERPRSGTEKAAVVSTLRWAAMEKVAGSIRARATNERRFIAK